MRPMRSTAVASTTTMPAREMASCIRCWRCQSVALPSAAEYWHMGETTMRLGSSTGPRASGEKSWDTGAGLVEDGGLMDDEEGADVMIAGWLELLRTFRVAAPIAATAAMTGRRCRLLRFSSSVMWIWWTTTERN